MSKLIAIVNVVAWAGFWAFGYLALTADPDTGHQMLTALILAAIGGGVGILAYLKLVCHCENTGYAERPKRAVPEQYRTEE